jgi:predicted dehydrogenase/threonine dehydrogenase-like Zn-dependent dehydrogenase
MRQVLIRGGRAVVEEMPVPACGPGEVLVRVAWSMISAGTESASLASSKPDPLVRRWGRRFAKAGEVARMVTQRGVKGTADAVRARLEGPGAVTGYSLAGEVVAVGERVGDLVPGQRVACAGASSAHHAELVSVPRQLVVPVPEGLGLEAAATVTLGAIAMQGVRQADLRLGEIAGVMGLGLLGQLTVSFLAASGCRVVGTDVDARRVERAFGRGLELGLTPGRDDVIAAIDHATGGRGLDAALLTASTGSSTLIREASTLLRHRGRLVVVGAVGMDLDRAPLYVREAELRLSCSYGPGRYDPAYEEEGHDYPYGHVRWTENRNMGEYLRLLAAGRVRVDDLVDGIFPLERAAEAFDALGQDRPEGRPIGLLLRYPAADTRAPRQPDVGRRSIEVVGRGRTGTGVGVALVGPGSFAEAVHLPHLRDLGERASLRAVVGRTAHSAREVARQWGATTAATDLDEILGSDDIDLVLIATRHDLHAEQAARCLDAGKAVFLEKPAALTLDELGRVDRAVAASRRPFALGFNRRFAPPVRLLRQQLDRRSGPVTITYRVNAGKLPANHWALGPQGGGRLIGEACHMVDLLAHLVGAPITAHRIVPLTPPAGRDDLPLGDNFALTCRHADGSLSELLYTSLGHAAAGKERIEVHWDGRSAELDDFERLAGHGVDLSWSAPRPDKGHRELLARFVAHARGEESEPVPWREAHAASRLTLELDRELRGLSEDDEA